MARYAMSVRSPRSQAEAFAFMADLTNFAEWDPGVLASKQVEGTKPELGAAFDVEVKSVGGSMNLRYVITEFDSPTRFLAKAESDRLTSVDVITVEADETGSIVTYDAELTLNGSFAIAEPALQLAFNSIGDKAAAGLVSALDGVRVKQ